MNIANPYLNPTSPSEINSMRLRRWAAGGGLCVAIVLIVAKFIAYTITDSVSIMTSLMDSTFDAVASTVTLLSIIHAATPADEQHRFGHGKLEAMAAFGQALFIFGSAGYLLFESAHRFIQPIPIKNMPVGMGVMALSIVLTVVLVSFQRYVIKTTKSVAISADHLHYKGDLLMNISVLTALLLSYFSKWPYFDPLFAVGISFVLLYGARSIGKESFDILMDKELSDEDRATIEKLVKSHKDVRAMHDLRTRNTGQQVFIEFHLELDGDLTLKKAHDITEDLELSLYKAFPKSEIMMHQEPAGIDDHRLDNQIKTA